MSQSSRGDVDKVINALPAALRAPASRWFERLQETPGAVPPPEDSVSTLVRAVAASEFAGRELLRNWDWFVARHDTLASAPDSGQLRDFVGGLADCDDLGAAKQRIRQFRQRFMLQVLWRELAGEVSLDDTLRALSDLADALLDVAAGIASRQMEQRFGVVRDESGEEVRIVILGMGKLGGRELNFSSDIDLIFLYPGGNDSDGGKCLSAQEYFTRVSRHIIALIDETTTDGFAFRIDTRLRPFGDSGPPVVSFAALESYLLKHGRDWERYAYVKARIVGPSPLDAVAEELYRNLIEPFVYRRYVDYGVFESLREMHALIAAEVRRRELADNIKLGPGGIREIEFIVQSLQLVRGGRDKELRARELQPMLKSLSENRGLSRAAAADLLKAYEFLRRLENFIQAIRDQQTHELPGNEADRQRLCLAMRVRDWGALVSELERHRSNVSRQFNEIALRGHDGATTDTRSTLLAELWAGNADPSGWQGCFENEGIPDSGNLGRRLAKFAGMKAAQQLDESSRRRLLRFLPRMIEALAGYPHPTVTLERMLSILESVLRRSAYLSLLNENEAALKRLLGLISKSEYLADQIARYPLLLDELLDARAHARPLTKDYLGASLDQQLARSPGADSEETTAILGRFQRATMFNVAVADFSGALPIMKVSDGLTWLAETVLERALGIAWGDIAGKHGQPCYQLDGERCVAGFGIVGYGKLGGLELSYGSDLDLVFLHDSRGERQITDGDKPIDNPVFFSRLVRRLVHLLTTQTGTGALYEIDTRLRPDGRSGVLVTSTDAFERYQEENAWTWEHQALLRARSVAGSERIAREFERIRHDTLMHRVRRESLRDDVIKMRRRMRSELDRSSDACFDLKHGAGGIGDIEFLVQFLVLDNAERFPAVIEFSDNIRQLDALAGSGCLDAAVAAELQDAYRAYRLAVHHLVLDEQPPIVAPGEFIAERKRVGAVWEEHLGV